MLLYRSPIPGRPGAERQMWQVRLGSQRFRLLTALLIAEGKVLKLGCLAPENEWESYEPAFENALYSFAFDDTPPNEPKHAALRGNAEVTKRLDDAKAKARLRSKKQLTALDIARPEKHDQIVQLLMKAR